MCCRIHKKILFSFKVSNFHTVNLKSSILIGIFPQLFFFFLTLQLPIGRKCIQHYREMSRNPVFSHEELVCKMAADPDGLDLDLAKAVYDEMLAVVEKEANRRHRLAKMVDSYQ